MMSKRLPFRRFFSPQRGFSLVEIMVAMVIGMIGVIVIMQVARTGEAQKRVTTGTGDAQNNGALAIYSVQRDVKQAGYGFNSLNVLGCPLNLPAGRPVTASPVPAVPASYKLPVLAPVVINPEKSTPSLLNIPSGDTGTDTVFIAYGSSNGAPEGDTIVGVSGVHLSMLSASNFRVGEWVAAAPSVPTAGCGLQLGDIKNITGAILETPAIGAIETGRLFDLGPAPRFVGYAIRNGDLTACDYMLADCSDVTKWYVIASGIVSLTVQYGRDTSSPMDGIDTWDRTTPVYAGNPEKFSCDWARISALRLALVARNGELQRDAVTTQVPDWAGGDALTSTWRADAANADWQKYRYQVFETVMPLRNIPWMGTCS
jgi:type IV pilus assembly protein PilW